MAEEFSGPEGEKTPAARGYAQDYPFFRQLGRTGAARFSPSLRGDKEGRVYTYSPDTITIDEYDQMRMDGQIRAGLSLIKLPVIQSPWSISCEDPDIAAFCAQVLKPIWPRTIRNLLLALDFGFSVFEKCWTLNYALKVTQTQGQYSAAKERVYPTCVVLDRLIQLDPKTLYILAYRLSGEFAGIKQYIQGAATIPANKCLIFSNDEEFSEWYGVSRLKPCYPFWVFKRLMYEFTNIFYETYSIPPKVGRYPIGRTEAGRDQNGNPTYENNVDVMMNLLDELRNNTSIALPSNHYDDQSPQLQWDIDLMETGRTGGDQLAYIDHLNAMILKSLLVPQLALEIGSSGSYALAETQINFFFVGEQALMAQIESAISTQVLKQLTRFNFGPNAPLPLFKFQPLAGDTREAVENLLMQTLGQGQPIPTKDGGAFTVDWQWLAEMVGIPLQTMDPKEYQKWQDDEAAKQAEAMGPEAYSGQDHQYGSPGDGAQPQDASISQGSQDAEDGQDGDESQQNFGEWFEVDGKLVYLAEELNV